MAFENVRLGWRRDREDFSVLEKARIELNLPVFAAPKSVSFRKILRSRRNQGDAGSCTGFGRTRAATAITYWQTGQIVEYSPLWAYRKNQQRCGLRGINSGATIEATVRSSQIDGEVLEKSYPYILRNYGERLPEGLTVEGETRQLLQHSKLLSPEEVFQWLASGKGAVIVGVDWTHKLANAGKYLDDAGSGSMGGHCMCISGYDGDELDRDGNPRFELDNSHGPDWADEGTSLISWKVVEQWLNQRWTDIRGVTDMETPDLIRPLPSPDLMRPRRPGERLNANSK
jgi:C1A family cysteine protease